VAGTVTIDEASTTTFDPSGYSLLGQEVQITAPPTCAASSSEGSMPVHAWRERLAGIDPLHRHPRRLVRARIRLGEVHRYRLMRLPPEPGRGPAGGR